MHGGVAPLDQFCSAELGKRFPVFFKHVECVPVFEVLEGNQPVAKPRPEVAGKLALADDEPVGVESVERPKPFTCDVQSRGVPRISRSETPQHVISRSRG